MKNRSVEQQIEMLRASMKWRAGRNLHNWLLGVAVMLAILSAAIWNPIPLVFATFFAIVGVFERRAAPNILNALAAYDTWAPAMGEISITITRWDSDDHYHVLVLGQGQPHWEYEFIPQGWSPVAGRLTARIWRQEGNRQPALAIVDEGILIPRYDPKHAGRGI